MSPAGLAAATTASFLKVLGLLGILSASGLVTGAFFGLLFGIPRSLTIAGQTVQANTNFEQISDWLTKVLIGVGLAELSPIKDLLVSLEQLLECQLSGTQIGGVAGLATLIAYFFAGFLWSYFESRTSLMAIFGEATRAGPQVTGLNPNQGVTTGGDVVTITGVGFTDASSVSFGSSSTSDFKVASDTQITANSPSGTGMVDVAVTTAAGTSPVGPLTKFTYAEPERKA